jgi:uncharacterized lipoprotein YehR (DUF1307 family)
MKSLNKLSLVTIILLLITSFTAVKEDELVGRWKGKDKGGIGFLSLSADGFATFEMNGQTMGGKSFEIRGVTATMRYSTDATTAPAAIDFIIYEENTFKEVSRLKGIYEMNTANELHLALTFEEGLGRPVDFSADNVMFYRVE